MGIRHTVPAGLPSADIANVVDGLDWRADHLHVPFSVEMVLAGAGTVTPAAASAALNSELFPTSRSLRNKVDLSQATQARLVAMVIANGNVAAVTFKLSFLATGEAATWAGADAGPVLPVGTGTVGVTRDTGWVNLAAGARVDNCVLSAVVGGAAVGTTAPTVSFLTCFLR